MPPVSFAIAQGYTPDLPDLDNPGSPNARNVIPRTSKSFGPYPSPTLYSTSALTARCQGAASFLDLSGNSYQVAGDINDLYEYKSSAWTKVSQTVGGYNCPGTGRWKFEYYNGQVFATDFDDPIQVFTLGTSSAFATLASAAPQCTDMAMVKGAFLVAVNTHDPVNGNQPQCVWWSAAGNPSNWPTPGSATAAQDLSSFNNLTGPGGNNQGIAAGLVNADAIILQQHAIWTMLYAGPPNVFDFRPIEGAKGCIAPGSIIVVSDTAFYAGEDGFYSCDGATSTPIGTDAVDHTFLADLDQNNISRICAAVDVMNRVIMWAYPGAGNLNGSPNHILCYRWDIGRWSILDVTVDYLVRLIALGYTLDQLYTTLGLVMDNPPLSGIPFDSPVWAGGAVNLGAFNTAHQLEYFNGPSLAATVDTGERILQPGRRALIGGDTRPLVDGGTPSIAIGRRNRLQDAVAFSNAVAMNSLGTCPQRTTGRYVRARITMPAGATWKNLWGAELDVTDAGAR